MGVVYEEGLPRLLIFAQILLNFSDLLIPRTPKYDDPFRRTPFLKYKGTYKNVNIKCDVL